MMRNLLPLTLLILAGCSQTVPVSTPTGGSSSGSTPVSIVAPEKRSLPRVVAQPGAILPFEETSLHAKIAGFVEVVHADIGKKVKAGEMLVELSVPELVQEAAAKKALIQRAKAEANQSRKAEASAQANVRAVNASITETQAGLTRSDASRQRWASESERISRLVQQGILDGQTRDETQNQYRAAQAAHDETLARVNSVQALAARAEADHQKAIADVAAAEAQIAVAKAEASRVEAMLAYTKIRAPYAGIVTRRHVNTGDFVQPTIGKAEGLFTVVKLDPVRIVVNVPEADAALVTEKCPVRLTIPALKGPPIETTVTRMAWSLEPGSRTLRVEIDRPNPDDRLRPGMYVYAHLTEQLPEGWTLPMSAVVKQGDDRVCFVVQGDKVVRTVVQIGANDGKSIQLLRLGNAEPTGQEKIARDATGLTDGATVAR